MLNGRRPILRHNVQEHFQFGNGPWILAKIRWRYPVCMASVETHIDIFELEDDAQELSEMPAGIGFDAQTRWETLLVLRSAFRRMLLFGRPIAVHRARTGHPFISLTVPALSPTGQVILGVATWACLDYSDWLDVAARRPG